jgi:hypothetical protein
VIEVRRSSRLVGAGTLALMLVGCGPGQLPDASFGTAADEIGESSTTVGSESPDSDDDSSASSIADEAPTSGPEGPEGPDDDAPTTLDDDATATNDDDAPDTSATATDSDDAPTTDDDDATTSDDDDDDATTSDDDDTNFGIPPDVTNEPCNPLAQDCFPTHKCVPYSTVPGSPFLDADKCMPILGDKGWGEPCTLSNFNEAQDDCDGEGFCWNLEWMDGALQGTCVPFCTGSPQNLMCPSGWGCLFSGAVALCSKQCNPLLQDCPNQYACYWVLDAFQCSLTGTLGQDTDPCDQANDCVPGMGCVAQASVPGCPGNEDSCCTGFCDLDTPNCPPGRECIAFFGPGEAPPGFADIGMCISP